MRTFVEAALFPLDVVRSARRRVLLRSKFPRVQEGRLLDGGFAPVALEDKDRLRKTLQPPVGRMREEIGGAVFSKNAF